MASKRISERLGVVDSQFGGLFTIQCKNPISDKISEVTISDEELRQIAEFRGFYLVEAK